MEQIEIKVIKVKAEGGQEAELAEVQENEEDVEEEVGESIAVEVELPDCGDEVSAAEQKVQVEEFTQAVAAAIMEANSNDATEETEEMDETAETVETLETAESEEEVNRLFATNVDKMSTERAAKILKDALEGRIDKSRISTLAPLAPKGGEMYLVNLDVLGHMKDALQDGFYWRHDGNKRYPKLVPGKRMPKASLENINVIKSIFKVKDSRVSRGVSNMFQRHTYRPADGERFILIHYIGSEEQCDADAVRGAINIRPRINRVRAPPKLNLVRAKRTSNSCVNCLIVMSEAETTRHTMHVRLGRRLFPMTENPTTPKPDLSIIEAVEDIMEGVLSLSVLRRYANYLICHDCMLVLRQAINRKLEAETSLRELHNRIDKITNEDRRKYYRENYVSDKSGRCWGCFFQFSKHDEKGRQKYGRHSLSMTLMTGLTVMEGIETMLEDEAESFFGLSATRLFICKQCFMLMKLIVRSQNAFDNLQSNFTSRTHPKSVMAELQGIVADSDDEFKVIPAILNESDIDDMDEEAEFEDDDEEEGLNESEVGLDQSEAGLDEEEAGLSQTVEGEEVVEAEDVSGELSGGTKREAEDWTGEEPLIKKVKEDGSESEGVDHGSVTMMEESEENGSKKITVRLTAIKPKASSKETEAAEVEASSSSSSQRIKTLPPPSPVMLKNLKTGISLSPAQYSQGWELQYDEDSAAQAGLVRLMLEVIGARYSDTVGNLFHGLKYPSLPVIRKGDLEISHPVVICKHLGEEHGLCPETSEDILLAEQVVQYCHDFRCEGHFLSIHLKTADIEKAAETGSEPMVQKFTERMSQWLSFFDQCLRKNKSGRGYLFGRCLTYADLALFHILMATKHNFPDVYNRTDFNPLLKSYCTRLSNTDRIKRYHKSSRFQGASSYLF